MKKGSSFWTAPHARLCAVLGLPYDGLEDDEVEKYFRQKRVREIAEYCENDVVNIFRIWLRRELFQGRLSNYGFQRSEKH